jgi:hypothetical protein
MSKLVTLLVSGMLAVTAVAATPTEPAKGADAVSTVSPSPNARVIPRDSKKKLQPSKRMKGKHAKIKRHKKKSKSGKKVRKHKTVAH